MSRLGGGWANGDAMHRAVAGRLSGGPRRVDRREARDLSMVLALATVAPLVVLALNVGAGPATTLGLTALSAAATAWSVRVLGREYALGLARGPFPTTPAAPGSGRASSRWRSAAFRLIPARHRPASDPATATAGVSGPAGRSRPARTRRPKPNG